MPDEVDPFEAAFASLVRDETKPAATTEVETPAKKEGEETPVAAAATTETPAAATTETPAAKVGEDGTPTELETPAEGDGKTTPIKSEVETGSGLTDEEILRRFASMMQKAPAAETTQQPQQTQTQQPRLYSDEEASLVQKYETDYPDVARAEALKRRAEYNLLTTHIFNQVAQALGPRLQILDSLAEDTQYNQLTAAVPDYDDIRDKVVDWVKTQPAYLQPVYNHVIAEGTADEVTDLIGRYRLATGATSPNPAAQGGSQVAQTPATKTAAELSPATKQAVARLAPISTKRSAPTVQDPLDFESAFTEFAKAL